MPERAARVAHGLRVRRPRGKLERVSALPTSSAAAQGVDPAAVCALVEAWEGGGLRPFAMTLLRHGHVVVDAVWAPYAPDDQVQKYSVSKTFTAAATGLAVAEGRLSVDQAVASAWPQVTGLGPRASAMRVEHLLTMTTGHTSDTLARLDPDDLVASFLHTEPDADPGTVFTYDNAATAMLSALVQQVTGEPLHDYLRPRLLDPLGVGDVRWLTVGPYDQGFSGLCTTNHAVARLGQTLLARGEHAGTRVLSAEWVDAMMTVHTRLRGEQSELARSADPIEGVDERSEDHTRLRGEQNELARSADPIEGVDERSEDHTRSRGEQNELARPADTDGSVPDLGSDLGYGYGMWQARHGWRATGAFGQVCLVLPEQDLVLAVCAQDADVAPLLDAVWEHLLPGLGGEPDAATRPNPVALGLAAPDAAEARPDALTAFFAGRALPTIASCAPPSPGRHQLRAVGPAAPAVATSGHVVVRDGTLVVEDSVGGVLVRLGDGRWERTPTTLPDDRTVDTAGTGGWTAPGVLDAHVVPLSSPHVLAVHADIAAGTADLRWLAEPLGTLTLTGWHPGLAGW